MNSLHDPIVTVYITNYNYAQYIDQAIKSVLQQSFHDFELIIIDDGSTDSSRDIILQYERHTVVRIIFQKNKGLNASNNVALKASRGKYIMRLDADDYLDPNALLVMNHILKEDPDLGLVFPDYYYVDINNQITGQERRHDFLSEVSLRDQPAHGACTMIRKDCLLELGGYNESYQCQDGYDLWLKMINRYSVRNVNLPLFYYRRHNENLTNNNELILKTRAQILQENAEHINQRSLNVLAILSVRGPKSDPGCLSLQPLGNKALIDWSIEETLKLSCLNELIVTSSDDKVLHHVAEKFPGTVKCHRRSVELGMENVSLRKTLEEVLIHYSDEGVDAILELTIASPFRSSIYLDKAINTMRIFDVDSVVFVVPETHNIFYHDGNGLKPVGNIGSELRLERDYLYRQISGTLLVELDYFKKNKKNSEGRVGHIVLDQRASTVIHSLSDLYTANILLQSDQ